MFIILVISTSVTLPKKNVAKRLVETSFKLLSQIEEINPLATLPDLWLFQTLEQIHFKNFLRFPQIIFKNAIQEHIQDHKAHCFFPFWNNFTIAEHCLEQIRSIVRISNCKKLSAILKSYRASAAEFFLKSSSDQINHFL